MTRTYYLDDSSGCSRPAPPRRRLRGCAGLLAAVALVALSPGCTTRNQPSGGWAPPDTPGASASGVQSSSGLRVDGGAAGAQDGDAAHEELFAEAAGGGYPSAKTCQPCHPTQFEEWAVSPHAYAQISPVFNAMHGTVVKLTNGTAGDFCIRCHSPVGMALEESLFTSNLNRHETSREGITCIVCHRVNKEYGKISGRLEILKGDLLADVYGPSGNENLREALENPDIGLSDSNDKPGRRTHGEVKKFFQLTQSSFCGTCHDVTLVNGFRLEEAFSEYKASPAAKRGISCQDCHMSTVPGVDSGYAEGPGAIVAGIPTKTRKITNHMFIGPDYSVVHPGIFPHSVEASTFADMREWLSFDHEKGWGTDEFEGEVDGDMEFPERWADSESRRKAREILDRQEALLARAHVDRLKILQEGYQLGNLTVHNASSGGIEFDVEVKNGQDGHGVPTGFIAERAVFLRVTVTDGKGEVIFKSGDLDPNGDYRDSHSLYVHNGELPQDNQLFSLQSKFITRNVRGGEREQVLAVNYSVDALPYVRPAARPTVSLGRPLGARIHKLNIHPGDSRTPTYTVPVDQLVGTSGPYRAKVELVAGMVPVNLIAAISGVGFDYGMSAREIGRKVVEGHLILAQFEDVELVAGRSYEPALTDIDTASQPLASAE